MVDILIKPPDMRRISDQLRSSAEKIGTALQNIDNDIRSLKGDKFLGSRSDKVQSLYAPKREVLLQAKNIVLHFSEELNNIATLFEKADYSGAKDNNSILPGDTKQPDPFITNPSVNQFLQSQRTLADIEKLLKTLYATKPLVIDEAMKKLGLDWINDIKDVIDLIKTENHWQEINQTTKLWEDAVKSFGADSTQASAAYEAYNKAWMDFPIIGKYIEVALNMGKANPVY